MNRTRRTLVGLVAGLTLMMGVSIQAAAQPGPDEEPPPFDEEDRPGAQLRQLGRLHMELGRYYLMDQQYELAAVHFLEVAEFELPDWAGDASMEGEPRSLPPGVVRVQRQAYLMAAVALYLNGDSEDAMSLAYAAQDLEGEEFHGRRHRRGGRDGMGEGRRGMGEGRRGGRDGMGEGRRRRGAMSPEEGGRGRHGRGLGGRMGSADRPDPVEEFLADPDTFVERFAGGAAALEQQVLEIESELSDDVSQ